MWQRVGTRDGLCKHDDETSVLIRTEEILIGCETISFPQWTAFHGLNEISFGSTTFADQIKEIEMVGECSMDGGENAYRFSTDLYVDERIKLKEILRKQDGRALTGLM
jgi:hypothetical protein